jgi:hypothetical protein
MAPLSWAWLELGQDRIRLKHPIVNKDHHNRQERFALIFIMLPHI